MSDEKLKGIIDALNKKYKKNIVIKGGEAKEKQFIPFSSPIPNWMSRGGAVKGKLIEFSGAEGSGKTTSALDIIKNFQLIDDRYTLFLDAENTFDDDWAIKLGVDLEKLMLIKPEDEYAETLLDMVLDSIRSGSVGLVVIDSIPFLRSKQEYEAGLEDKTYAGNSGIMTVFSGKVIPLMNKYGTTVIMINQLRDKIGVAYTAYNTVGGRMLKHSFSQRFFFSKGKLLDAEYKEQSNSFENPIANFVDIKYIKNKVTKDDRKSSRYTLNYSFGVDVVYDTVDLGVRLGVIEKSGNWYKYKNLKEQGLFSLVGRVREDVKTFNELKQELEKFY